MSISLNESFQFDIESIQTMLYKGSLSTKQEEILNETQIEKF